MQKALEPLATAPSPPHQPGGPLLEVRDLTVEFATRRGTVTAVREVDLTVAKGEVLGIVGESGSGKSVTSYAVMRILDRAGRIAQGSVMFSGVDLVGATDSDVRDLRGRELSMIFQNPRAALNPIRTVGRQIEDVLRRHARAGSLDIRRKAVEALDRVRIARPKERYHAYPFELSGGMCQRIVIALALACRPQLLIADEPTTGLDVTTQKAVMDLVVELTRERAMSTILITHDLGLAAAYCDRVVVMEKGRVVETAMSQTIFRAPEHAYTRKLMRATPRPGSSLRSLLPEDGASPDASLLGRSGASPDASLLGRSGASPDASLLGRSGASPDASLLGRSGASPDASLLGRSGASPDASLLGRSGASPDASLLGRSGASPDASLLGRSGASPDASLLGRSGASPDASAASGAHHTKPAAAPDVAPLLAVTNLVKEYPRKTAGTMADGFRAALGRRKPEMFRAVDGISFSISTGESVGLVGESGCGKSTTSMMLMRLLDPTAGSIVFDGVDIGAIPARAFARSSHRPHIQMVFQDPTDSLNPRFTAARAIADPILRLGTVDNRANARAHCEALATQVGLPLDLLDRFPHQLSGGQKARVGIARAIALSPKLVVLDEPTAALDVSVQAVVLNLLADLKDRLGMSYLFVSHDLNVVRLLCDRVIVMRGGQIVEQGGAEQVLSAPQSDYTKELIAAIPHPPH